MENAPHYQRLSRSLRSDQMAAKPTDPKATAVGCGVIAVVILLWVMFNAISSFLTPSPPPSEADKLEWALHKRAIDWCAQPGMDSPWMSCAHATHLCLDYYKEHWEPKQFPADEEHEFRQLQVCLVDKLFNWKVTP